MKGRLLTTLICIFLAPTIATAQTLDFYASPHEIWAGGSVELICEGNVTGQVYTNITSPIKTLLPMNKVNESYYAYPYTPYPQHLGTFEAYCTNGSVSSTAKSFVVSALVVDILDISSMYSDEEVSLSAKAYKINDAMHEIQNPGILNFSLYLDTKQVAIDQPYYSNAWHITTDAAPFEGRNYTLRLRAEYSGEHANFTETLLQVRPALEFSITSLAPASVTGGEEITAGLQGEYHGMDIFGVANLSVSLHGQQLSFTRIASGIKFNTPMKEPGTYNLVISMDYNGLQASDTRQLDYVVPIHGEVIDADGKGVSGSLRFSKTGYSKTITITNGLYSDYVPYGNYEVLAEFAGFRSRFAGVPITGEVTNIIRFDKFSNLDLDGLRIAGSYAIEFTPSFQRAYMEADYDASKLTGSEDDIEVYKCGNWNLDARKCSGSWSRVPSDVNVVNNKVSFEADSLSAFVIGEMRKLTISASIDRDEYYFGQDIKLTGVVKDMNNNVVPDATVTYTIGATSETLTTNSNGVFSADVPVPRTEGRNVLIINASHMFYYPAGSVLELEVLRKKEMKIIPPEDTEIPEGGKSVLDVKIANTGDIALNNIKISVSGLPQGSDYTPKSISRLPEGEEATIWITFVPGDSDKRVYTLSVSLESDETSYTDSFVVTVSRNQTAGTNKTPDQTPQQGLNLTTITAYFTANGTAIMNTGSIITAVVIISFLGIKVRRKARLSSGKRQYMIHLLNTIKQEVLRGLDRRKLARRRGRPGKTRQQKTRKPKLKKQKPASQKRPEPEYLETSPHETGVG